MAHFIYILRSVKDGGYYIGETADVAARLAYHNSGKQRSTRSRIPFELLHVEIFDSRTQALKREKQIKSWKGGEAFKTLLKNAGVA